MLLMEVYFDGLPSTFGRTMCIRVYCVCIWFSFYPTPSYVMGGRLIDDIPWSFSFQAWKNAIHSRRTHMEREAGAPHESFCVERRSIWKNLHKTNKANQSKKMDFFHFFFHSFYIKVRYQLLRFHLAPYGIYKLRCPRRYFSPALKISCQAVDDLNFFLLVYSSEVHT